MRLVIDEQVIIPLNNVAYSIYPSIIEPHDGSSSSQTLNAVLQSPEMLSPSDDRTTPSLHTSVSDDSEVPICTTQSHFVSSPTTDTRRPHHRLRGYRSDSTEFVKRLGSGEISRLTSNMTLVTNSSQMSFDLSTGLSHEAIFSISTRAEDQGIPVLARYDIYPVAPENFSRYEKRRKM